LNTGYLGSAINKAQATVLFLCLPVCRITPHRALITKMQTR